MNFLCSPFKQTALAENTVYYAGLEIATNMVANATRFSSLATKNNFCLVATLATWILHDFEVQ